MWNSSNLFHSLADWAWVREPDNGRILDINAAAVKALGYSREELIGRPIHELYFDPTDRERIEAFEKQVQKAGTAFWILTLRDKAGRPLEVEIHGSILRSDDRPLLLILARHTSAQTGERRRALIFYEGFKRSNDVMFYCDRNGVILDINDAFTKHYGYTRREAVGQKPSILRSRHSTEELYRRMWESILDPKKGFWHGQMINKAKDGHEVPVILTITAVKDASGETVGYISNAIDMSELFAMQMRLADSEALAAIGEMAAVVAHEIRNPLGSIVMAARQLVEGSLQAEDRRLVLEVLQSESRRLNEALTNFLAYARPREIRLQSHDLNDLAAEVCRMVRSNQELIKQIKTSLSLSKKLRPFPLDPDLIRQVLWNIILNAVQAMEGKGTLSVETGRSGGYAYVRVKDTGPGIPADKLGSIFKAFQTTKQQGTGLGLAIAQRIVKAHGGRIEAHSKGRGASFTVYIPYIEE